MGPDRLVLPCLSFDTLLDISVEGVSGYPVILFVHCLRRSRNVRLPFDPFSGEHAPERTSWLRRRMFASRLLMCEKYNAISIFLTDTAVDNILHWFSPTQVCQWRFRLYHRPLQNCKDFLRCGCPVVHWALGISGISQNFDGNHIKTTFLQVLLLIRFDRFVCTTVTLPNRRITSDSAWNIW